MCGLGALLLTSRQFLLPLAGLLERLAGGLVSASRLAGQHQTGSLHGLVLDVEQVGRMMSTEMLFGMCEERFGFIAGDLTNGHRPTGQSLVEALIPGRGVALGCVLF